MVNDPIADLLTQIRNANERLKQEVVLQSSNLILQIVKILKEESYIEDFSVSKDEKTSRDMVSISLKYIDKMPAIKHLQRISKPGVRTYMKYKDIKEILNGFGISIFSTPKGIMTGKQARQERLGGEYLCNIW